MFGILLAITSLFSRPPQCRFRAVINGKVWQCPDSGKRRVGTFLCDTHDRIRFDMHEQYHAPIGMFRKLELRHFYQWTFGFICDAGHRIYFMDLYHYIDSESAKRHCPHRWAPLWDFEEARAAARFRARQDEVEYGGWDPKDLNRIEYLDVATPKRQNDNPVFSPRPQSFDPFFNIDIIKLELECSVYSLDELSSNLSTNWSAAKKLPYIGL